MISVKCRNCGLVDRTREASCRRCGSPVGAEETGAEASPSPSQSALLRVVLIVGLVGGGLVLLKYLVVGGHVRLGLLTPLALTGLYLLRRHLLDQ